MFEWLRLSPEMRAEADAVAFTTALSKLIRASKGKVSRADMIREMEIHLAGLRGDKPYGPGIGPATILREGDRVDLVRDNSGAYTIRRREGGSDA